MTDLVATPHRVATPHLSATYRLQLRDGLTLDDVADGEWPNVLSDLGISHVYLSPIFSAAHGSTHGYDVVDHATVDPALGGEAALARLADRCHAAGLGVVLDLVPNHMAADPAGNADWWDVLANGRSSIQAEFFDVDWTVPEIRLHGRILLPVLADHCGREIEAGKFTVDVSPGGELVVVHESATVPLELASVGSFLRDVAAQLEGTEFANTGLDELATRALALPFHDDPDPTERERRQPEETALRQALRDWLVDDQRAAAVRSAARTAFGEPAQLDQLLESQPYRLARWRAGLEDLGYRRFFDVTSLVALRIDSDEAFEKTHCGVRRWLSEGWVDAVRVDHIDGLADPDTYLQRLRQLVGNRPIFVEKILEGDESLPPWPIEGTTGYEVAEVISRLEVDDRGRPALERLAELAGTPTDVDLTESDCMRLVLASLLAADVNRLVDLLVQVCERRRRLRDVTRREIELLLVDLVSRFRRYRTYARPGLVLNAIDAEFIDGLCRAVTEDGHDPDLIELVRGVIEGVSDDPLEAEVCVRFQQLTGPARAKGCEDTAWYRLISLASRCEVGSDPGAWNIELADFHQAMEARHELTPLALTATSTHDSKRSTDVRSRIDVLSQWSSEFADVVETWWKEQGTGDDAHMDLLLIQTLFGTPGIDARRLKEYALKATRESKLRTSWLDPDETYEATLADRIDLMLADPGLTSDLAALSDDTEIATRDVTLARTLLSLTVPGVPDLYQGGETWSYRLVDPDNRERVDPGATRGALAGLGAPATALPIGPEHVSAKLAVTRAALELRMRRPECFDERGSYRALWATGPRADHVVGFRRGDDVVVVTARLVRRVAEAGWEGTTIDLDPEDVGSDGRDAGIWIDRCTGREWSGRVEIEALFDPWPVAILERTTSEPAK